MFGILTSHHEHDIKVTIERAKENSFSIFFGKELTWEAQGTSQGGFPEEPRLFTACHKTPITLEPT